jgi:UDP-2,4-diacetamido-2,4,6-trideoxy-beta-L-altropyranose hydrolase
MMRVLVRVDASALLGAGHVMRCLALAGELKSRGNEVVFVMRPLVGHMMDEARAAGFDVLGLPDLPELPDLQLSAANSQAKWIEKARSPDAQQRDASETLALLPHQSWDWLLLDHYALGAHWQVCVANVAHKLLVIDDQADRSLQCDLLLNQNPGAQAKHYAGLIPPGSQLLSGPQYALLRPEFSSRASHVRGLNRASAAARVLVSLGGVDPHGLALQVVLALADCGFRGGGVTVLAGTHNPHEQELLSTCQDLGFVGLKSTHTMAQLMEHADWAVGAGGVSLLERCAMGLPSIALAIASNQRPGVAAAQSAGAVLALDPLNARFPDQLRRAIQSLLTEPERLKAMSQAAMSVCDGRGTVRVADELQAGSLALRVATLRDTPALYAWRNALETRQHSGDGLAFSAKQHVQWMSRVLADPARRLWIASTTAGPIGVLRFDTSPQVAPTTAEISVYRVPGQPGRGWGRALIARGIQEAQRTWPELRQVNAHISDDNLPSLGAFAACGFAASTISGRYQKSIEGFPL